MEALNFIKKYHKPYIGNIDNSYYDENNHNYDYYLDKYIYTFKFDYYDENDKRIEIYKSLNKSEYNKKYNKILVNDKYISNEINKLYHTIYFFNNELYVNDDFLILFIDEYLIKYFLINNYKFSCSKIIIDFNYDFIKKYLNNEKYNNIQDNIINYINNFDFIGDTIIFENGLFNSIKCNDFICNSQNINQYYFNMIDCNKFIINNYSINIKELILYDSFIINSNKSNSQSIIKILKFYSYNLFDFNIIQDFYKINKLVLNDNIQYYEDVDYNRPYNFNDIDLYSL